MEYYFKSSDKYSKVLAKFHWVGHIGGRQVVAVSVLTIINNISCILECKEYNDQSVCDFKQETKT